MKKSLGLLAAGIVALAAMPANAVTYDGITYDLTGAYTSADHHSAHFILNITGINEVTDPNNGRYGVESYAFTEPNGLVSGSSPGFTFMFGGLQAAGCNSTGNFFCFKDNLPNPSTVLPANSSLQFTFDLILAAGNNFDNYDADFKINWIGTKNNYDLVSKPLPVTGGVTPFVVPPGEVPIPGAVWLFASGLAGIGMVARRRKNKKLELAVV